MFEILLKSEQKKQDTFKNWPLIKNPQFLSNPYETWWKWLTHEVINFTKFHEDWTKIVDSLWMVDFWMCPVFFCSDLNIYQNLLKSAFPSELSCSQKWKYASWWYASWHLCQQGPSMGPSTYYVIKNLAFLYPTHPVHNQALLINLTVSML